MKNKKLVFSIAMIAMLTMGLAAMISVRPARAQVVYGPKADNLLIHVYANPDAEFEALDAGTIDIIDWPLTKTWIDQWTGDPDVEMRSYAEIGHMEFDINNQLWPTGITENRVQDPKSGGTWKHFYDSTPDSVDTDVWDDEATEFRKAIAYLTDKEGYVTRILKGFGYAQETNVAYPECGGWVPVAPYTGTSGYSYLPITFNPATAKTTLDDAGFTEGSTPNPYYDSSKAWSAEYLRTDPRFGGDLRPLDFYLRMDDPQRRDAGRELTTMLRKSGIQVNPIETERTVCYKQCMVLYDYHLYTGGWSLSADAPDSLHFLAHSSMYWGGTETSHYGGTGWSANYAGFAHSGLHDPYVGLPHQYYDYWAEKAHYPADKTEALNAGKEAQAIETNFVPMIPLWAAAAVKAYRSHFTGVQNMKGYGVDNYFSFLNMYSATDNTIDWGFKSNLEGPNAICSEWVWDWYILGLIYEGLIARNPHDLSEEFGFLAKDWTVGDWAPGKMYAEFTLRSAGDSADARDPKFHNGDLVRPLDVAFSLIFMRDCGPGVCWVYSDLADIVKIGIPTGDTIPTWLLGSDIFKDTTISSGQVKIYFDVKSYWALHWAGFQVILNERIWKLANDANGWGYTGVGGYLGFTNRMKVREYTPWTQDSDLDGTVDMKEDGTGAWVFESAVPLPISTSTSLAFSANRDYYLSQDYISDYLEWAFHCSGDVTDDGKVDIADGFAIAKSTGTNKYTHDWGTGWDEYNYNADINVGTWDMAAGTGTYGDDDVDVFDINKWGRNYGVKQ